MERKKGNKNSKRSEKLIRQAFLNLLLEKDYEKITVTDVINSAEISRATFYAHYSDIHNLLEHIEEEILDRIDNKMRNFGVENVSVDPAAFIDSILLFMESNLELCKMIARSRNAHTFYMQFSDMVRTRLMATVEDSKGKMSETGIINFLFIFNAVSSLLFEWCCGNIKVTFDSLKNSILTLLQHYSQSDMSAFFEKAIL